MLLKSSVSIAFRSSQLGSIGVVRGRPGPRFKSLSFERSKFFPSRLLATRGFGAESGPSLEGPETALSILGRGLPLAELALAVRRLGHLAKQRPRLRFHLLDQ
jgi:hypothetical protein